MLLSKYKKREGLMINLNKHKVGTRLLLSFSLLIFLSAANADRNDDTLVLDVDASGTVTPLTDGIMILRSLFGFTDDAITEGAVGANCQDCDSEEIGEYIADIRGLTFGAINATDESITDPQRNYSIISSEILDSGLVRTKLYAYEEGHGSGRIYFVDAPTMSFPVGSELAVEGHERIVNALGEFEGSYQYFLNVGGTYTSAAGSEFSPVSCPDGSQLPRSSSLITYGYSMVNSQGSFVFSNRGTTNAGVYLGCEDYASTLGYPQVEYYYLEGSGAGIYSCVSRVAFYGAAYRPGWSVAYTPSRQEYPNVYAGNYDRSSNGLWGTFYLEIDAPADCLNLES